MADSAPNLGRLPDVRVPSDGSLVHRVRSGDEEAAAELFGRYAHRLHRLADRRLATNLSGRLDVEDITQSIFRTLFRRIGDGQYDVPPGKNIWALLTTIALNKVRSVGAHHRAAKRDIRRMSSSDASYDGDGGVSDDDALRILEMTIEDLLGQLTDVQRQIVELRLEEHDVATISGKVGRSKRTVERVLEGFRNRLREVIH